MPVAGERFDRASGTEPYKPQTRALKPFDIQIRKDWNPRTMTSPVTRPKAQSATEKITKSGGQLLDLADTMCRLILDPHVELGDLEVAAKAYKKVRGL